MHIYVYIHTETIALRTALEKELTCRGVTILPSATNFVAVRYSTPEDAAWRQLALLKVLSSYYEYYYYY